MKQSMKIALIVSHVCFVWASDVKARDQFAVIRGTLFAKIFLPIVKQESLVPISEPRVKDDPIAGPQQVDVAAPAEPALTGTEAILNADQPSKKSPPLPVNSSGRDGKSENLPSPLINSEPESIYKDYFRIKFTREAAEKFVDGHLDCLIDVKSKMDSCLPCKDVGNGESCEPLKAKVIPISCDRELNCYPLQWIAEEKAKKRLIAFERYKKAIDKSLKEFECNGSRSNSMLMSTIFRRVKVGSSSRISNINFYDMPDDGAFPSGYLPRGSEVLLISEPGNPKKIYRSGPYRFSCVGFQEKSTKILHQVFVRRADVDR